MWMDIYIALPPYNEPRFDQKYGNWGGKIRPILYEEDEIRAWVFGFGGVARLLSCLKMTQKSIFELEIEINI